MHFSVTTREFSSILEGVKKLSPQFPPAKNLLQVKKSFMRRLQNSSAQTLSHSVWK